MAHADLATPKGWTGPKTVDGVQIEGTFRAHQVPITDVIGNARHRAALEGMDARVTVRKNSLTKPAADARICRNWRRAANGAWAPTRTRTAVRCCKIS